MAVAMFMQWQGVTAAQYDEVRRMVNWENDVPDGALFHIATFDGEGAHIVDLWERQADFERFVAERLTPAIEEAGIEGEPTVVFRPAHAIFAPAYEHAHA